MRKIYLLVLSLMVSICLFGQSRNDQKLILQKCIDLPEMKPYYQLDADGKIKQLTICYWHPSLFPVDLGLTKDGKNVEFVVMSEKAGKAGDAFFLFKTFEVADNSAIVCFEYSYGTESCSKKIQASLDFDKEGDEWKVTRLSVINKE